MSWSGASSFIDLSGPSRGGGRPDAEPASPAGVSPPPPPPSRLYVAAGGACRQLVDAYRAAWGGPRHAARDLSRLTCW